MLRRGHLRQALGAAVAGVWLASSALAQAPDVASRREIEEILVTARKREERPREIGLQMTARF